ncbi:MAG: hypothetical protein E7587_09300 [Ruminococcaceae bacterium]|nr:hypothetical protein [Oscillospiraceae bacterium]
MNEKYIDISVEFTDAYKKHSDSDPAIREAMCLKCLYPSGLMDLKETDFFAGNGDVDANVTFSRLPVTFHPKTQSQIAYYASLPTLRKLAAEYPHRNDEIQELIEFWKKEATFVKIREQAPPELKDYYFPPRICTDSDGYMRTGKKGTPLGAGFISGSFDTRIAGIMPDFEHLLKSGIDGLYKEADIYEKENGNKTFYTALRLNLDIIRDTLEHYRKQAKKLSETASSEHCARLCKLEKMLFELQHRPPVTLYEAMQLTVILTVLIGLDNFGRMDVYFGDFLASDLDNGILCEESAINLISEFWDFISRNCGAYDSRVIIGGKGRHNEKNADRFSILALEAARRRHQIKPVLTLRFYKGQNPALFEKGIDLIAEGCIYPTLYNDDLYIEGVMKSMNLPYEDALDYAPLGCGEMVIAGKSVGSPNSTFRILKALEAALHNGHDGASGDIIGIQTGEIEELDSFDALMDALFKQLEARIELDAKMHAHQRAVSAKEAAFVMPSILMKDCIKRGKDIFHGGIRYFGANFEGFGLINTINSLAVIKKLVYDEKILTLSELVHILDVDFEGYEKERQMFLSVDKYGNNKAWVDDMKLPIEAFINERADYYGRKYGFHYCTIANVNPGGIIIGPATAASADGRQCGKPFALANSPMPGTDTSGITAMLLSCAKADAANGGYVTNMNVSRSLINTDKKKFSELLKRYFEIGGLQLNINCYSKDDMENALKEPEKYKNLIVRVSGYSARFIDLDSVTQKYVMERTLF